tara:strand:- start:1248 stop:1640 length:393 start_codon:yes stop_codon:yes gene_type:complete
MNDPLRAVAGVLRRDGMILIGKRRIDDNYGGLWEFPGGKVEQGESDVDCLRREIEEELGLEVEVGPLILVNRASPTFELSIYEAALAEGEPQLREHDELRWVTAEQLPDFEMLPADGPVIGILNASRDDD